MTVHEYCDRAGLEPSTRLAIPALRAANSERAGARVGDRLDTTQVASWEREATKPAPHQDRAQIEHRLELTRQSAVAANRANAHAHYVAAASRRPPKTVDQPRSAKPQVCRVCGGDFTDPKGRTRVTCSNACRIAWNRRRWDAGHAARKSWGIALRERRRAGGMTGTELAAAVATNSSRISRIEWGKVGVTAALYGRLKAVFPDLPEPPGSVLAFTFDSDDPA